MLNKYIGMGRLTKNPELRYTQSNTPVTSFTIAVDRDFGGKDGGEKQTDFIDCVAWNKTGEFVAKHFAKGQLAVVSGRLQSRKWQDRDGNNRISWEIIADNVYFGGDRKAENAADVYGNKALNVSAPELEELPGDDGELPF